MAHLISERSVNDVRSAMVNQIINTTPLKDISVGTTLNGMVVGAANEISRLRDDINAAFGATYLDEATGVFLSLMGAEKGITRGVNLTTKIACSEQAIAIRTKDNTPLFDSLASQAGAYRVIGLGFTVSSSSDYNLSLSTNEVSYFLPTDTIVYLGVAGALSNKQVLPPGTLNRFEWDACSPFIGANLANLELVQIKTINGIEQVETEEAFKQRIRTVPTRMATANTTAIATLILSHPEVADIRIINNVRGTGSANIIAIPMSGRITSGAINVLQDNVNRVKSFGEDIQVKAPAYVQVSMAIKVLGISQVNTLKNAIIQAFSRMGLGETLSHERIKTIAADVGITGITINNLIIDGIAYSNTGVFKAQPEELLELATTSSAAGVFDYAVQVS